MKNLRPHRWQRAAPSTKPNQRRATSFLLFIPPCVPDVPPVFSPPMCLYCKLSWNCLCDSSWETDGAGKSRDDGCHARKTRFAGGWQASSKSLTVHPRVLTRLPALAGRLSGVCVCLTEARLSGQRIRGIELGGGARGGDMGFSLPFTGRCFDPSQRPLSHRLIAQALLCKPGPAATSNRLAGGRTKSPRAFPVSTHQR